MPVQVGCSEFVKFRYEPDYLRGHESLITPAAICDSVPHLQRLRMSAVNLDGGNVVAAGDKVILTEKVFRENRHWSRQGLITELERLFHAECVLIPPEPGDEIGHADGVVRFLDEQTVIVNDYREVDRGYGKRLAAVLRRHDFHMEGLPYFCTGELVNGIGSAVGNYLNFLRVAGLVVVPAYGAPEDEIACRRLEGLLPGTRIVPIRCAGLAREGGVLNCISWTIRTEQGNTVRH